MDYNPQHGCTAALALRGSKAEDGDIALVDNGRDHYNALVPAVSS